MEQSIIQSLGFLLRFQEDIKIPQPHGTINHTIIRVSCRVSRRYQNPLAPKEQLTLQFLISFKQISRSCGHMEQLNIQSLGFLLGFQDDIKIPRPHGTFSIQSLGFFLGFKKISTSSSSSSSWLAQTLVVSPGKPQGLAVILMIRIMRMKLIMITKHVNTITW